LLVVQYIDGFVHDKIKTSIERYKTFEPPEGYYLAFSGGKDSQSAYELAKEAEVKFDAHYNLTTVDSPELIQFIKTEYPNVKFHYPEKTMWQLIEEKGLPTRRRRYCCSILKEGGGEGRTCVTGVRWAESKKRKNNRGMAEILGNKKSEKILFNDNEKDRRMFESCQVKGKRIVNPIVDWQDEDVWEYIKLRELKYCNLYDEGFERLGCIGCPLAGTEQMIKEFKRWPKYYDSYYRAVERFLIGYFARCEKRKAKPFRDTAQGWMDWWIYEQEIIDYTDSFLDDEV
jgi:phosphoadenosine phosphosulfate reductase